MFTSNINGIINYLHCWEWKFLLQLEWEIVHALSEGFVQYFTPTIIWITPFPTINSKKILEVLSLRKGSD